MLIGMLIEQLEPNKLELVTVSFDVDDDDFQDNK